MALSMTWKVDVTEASVIQTALEMRRKSLLESGSQLTTDDERVRSGKEILVLDRILRRDFGVLV